MGPGRGPNQIVAKLAVQVVNQPEPSTRKQFFGNLPTCVNWAGSQRVHLWIHTRLLFLQFDNSILPKSCIEQPMIHFCMHCSWRYRLIWNPSFSYDILCFSQWRSSIILLCAWRAVWCLDTPICMSENCRRSIDALFQHAAGSVSLLILPLKAANISSMDVCNQSELRLPKMAS